MPSLLLGLGFVLIVSFFFLAGSKSLEEIPVQQGDSLSLSEFILPKLPAAADFRKFILHELDSTGTVGAAYTIVYNGEIVETGTYGIRKAGSPEKVDQHTVFRVASLSKGFAGALACLLEQDGVVCLDDHVLNYYPGFCLKDSCNTHDLTLRHLLSHTSGLVPSAFDNLVEAGRDLPTIVSRLTEVDISAPPGKLYGYQNVIFSMIDPILQGITGIPYQQLLHDRIFAPVGMTDASAGLLDPAVVPNIAYPHVMGRNGYISGELHMGYYNVMPAAGVNASISDMGQWLLALLGNKPGIFPDTVTRLLATPVIYTPLKSNYTRQWQPFRERYYSLGWRIYNYRGRTIIYHGGYVRGYRAEIGFCPEEKAGIAFLQNSPNGLASKSVPAFFDRLFDSVDAENSMKTADFITLTEN
jgi:beta-lactamase class C